LEPGGLQGECGMEFMEVGQDGVDSQGELEVGGISRGAEGGLELAKESIGTREGKGHGLELAQGLVPLGSGYAVLGGGDAIKEFQEAGAAVVREGKGHGNSVDVPTQNGFGGGPAGITSKAFFEGNGFFLIWPIQGVKRAEYTVDCM